MSIEFIENIKPTSILKSNNALRRLYPTFNASFERSGGFQYIGNNIIFSPNYDGTFSGTSSSVTDIVTIGRANVWIDAVDNIWSTNNNQLVGSTSSSNGFQNQFLRRPNNETVQDISIKVELPANYVSGDAILGLCLRMQANGNHYLTHITESSTFFYRIEINGSATYLAELSWEASINNSREHTITFAISGTDSIELTTTVTDKEANEIISSLSVVDSDEARIPISGVSGLSCWNFGSVTIDRVIIN